MKARLARPEITTIEEPAEGSKRQMDEVEQELEKTEDMTLSLIRNYKIQILKRPHA